ncbi:MAG: hypothetical protein GY866_30745 [Proteobacteria bacterium]|nr:hypothetical protein [Pseudomonadota bacterium]
MNRSDADMGEFADRSETFLANDEIPDTLKAVLKHIGEDLVPETQAAAECIDQWLEENAPKSGTPIPRGVGFGEFDLRGVTIQALAQPYRFLLLAKMQKALADLDQTGRQSVQTLFDGLGLAPMLSAGINRQVRRHDHLEVWG